MIMEEGYKWLFTAVKEIVQLAGGDGNAYIVSEENYEKYATMFEEYEKNSEFPVFINKFIHVNSIDFCDNQQSITFCKYRQEMPPVFVLRNKTKSLWLGDITIELP